MRHCWSEIENEKSNEKEMFYIGIDKSCHCEFVTNRKRDRRQQFACPMLPDVCISLLTSSGHKKKYRGHQTQTTAERCQCFVAQLIIPVFTNLFTFFLVSCHTQGHITKKIKLWLHCSLNLNCRLFQIFSSPPDQDQWSDQAFLVFTCFHCARLPALNHFRLF